MAEMSIWVPVISAFGGAVIAGGFSFANNLINKRTEEKKHLREIMLNAAIANWKQNCDFAIEKWKRGIGVKISPLDSFVIHMAKLTEVLLDGNLTKENLEEKCKQISEITEAHSKYLQNKENNDDAQQNY